MRKYFNAFFAVYMHYFCTLSLNYPLVCQIMSSRSTLAWIGGRQACSGSWKWGAFLFSFRCSSGPVTSWTGPFSILCLRYDFYWVVQLWIISQVIVKGPLVPCWLIHDLEATCTIRDICVSTPSVVGVSHWLWVDNSSWVLWSLLSYHKWSYDTNLERKCTYQSTHTWGRHAQERTLRYYCEYTYLYPFHLTHRTGTSINSWRFS